MLPYLLVLWLFIFLSGLAELIDHQSKRLYLVFIERLLAKGTEGASEGIEALLADHVLIEAKHHWLASLFIESGEANLAGK